MGKIIDVNQASFARDVIAQSYSVPVIVDFWAPWCGPCRMLGPLLERLTEQAAEPVILAKLNTDQNQQLAMQYDIRGIPAVKAFHNGQVIDSFVGAQPEPNVRRFIQRVTASARPGDKAATATADDAAERLTQARKHLLQGNGRAAAVLLRDFPTGPQQRMAARLEPLAAFMQQPERAGTPALAPHLRDAAGALAQREPSGALYHLLIAWQNGSAAERKALEPVVSAIFALLGDDSPVVSAYRERF